MSDHTRGRINVGNDDTGTFEAMYHATRVNVDGTSKEPQPIYGLELTEDERKEIDGRRRTLRTVFIFIGIAVVIALIGGFFAIRSLIKGGVPQTSQDEDSIEQVDASTQDSSSVAIPLTVTPTADDIWTQAANLSFDGTSLAVPQDQLEVLVQQGYVQVTHNLTEDVYDDEVNAMVGDAALRAAALCNLINEKMIIGPDDAQPYNFESVLWIVRNMDGDSYIAIYFPKGSAPSYGDGLSVLAESPRYRMSDSTYYALQTDDDLSQQVGETPTMLNEELIWSTAAVAYR